MASVLTLSELRTRVRDALDEDTARFWTDAQLNRWINDGAHDVARRSEVLQDTDDVTASSGTQEYTLTNDVLRVYRVEWQPGDSTANRYALEYRDFNSMDAIWWSQQKSSTGYPYWYTLWGYPPQLKLIVYPTPSEDGHLFVHHYRLPADMSDDGDDVELPIGWDEIIINYVEYVALRKDADPRWREAKEIYEEKLGQLVDVSRRWSDQADAIQVGASQVPHWLYADW